MANTHNPGYQEQVMSDGAHGMTPEQQADYWQRRCFREMDEKAALINQLQEIRRILDA